MKIIFLDVDGVLNAGRSVVEKPTGFENFSEWVIPKAVEHLNRITDATGARLVISSTWRIGKKMSQLREMFASVGVKAQVISKTENGPCNWHEVLGYRECSTGHRGAEIHDWITRLAPPGEVIESFIIIDDSSDMGPHMDRLVHTDCYRGLSRRKVNEAVRLLGFKPMDLKQGKCDDTDCLQCYPLPTL